MPGAQADKLAEDVRALIEERLRIRARSLDRAIAKAGRLLPKWAQHDGRYLAQAAQFTDHPKLRMMIDEAKVAQAHRALTEHLKSVNPAERRVNGLLSVLGSISFGLLVLIAAVIAVLMWRGYL